MIGNDGLIDDRWDWFFLSFFIYNTPIFPGRFIDG